MLEENKLVFTKGKTIELYKGEINIEWKCKCGDIHKVGSISELDELLNSDSHNPSEDFIECSVCERMYSLYKGVKINFNGSLCKLYSDGTFVYIEFIEGKVIRIL